MVALLSAELNITGATNLPLAEISLLTSTVPVPVTAVVTVVVVVVVFVVFVFVVVVIDVVPAPEHVVRGDSGGGGEGGGERVDVVLAGVPQLLVLGQSVVHGHVHGGGEVREVGDPPVDHLEELGDGDRGAGRCRGLDDGGELCRAGRVLHSVERSGFTRPDTRAA